MDVIEERVLTRQPTMVGKGILFLAEIGPWLTEVYDRVAAHVAHADGALVGPPFARFTPLGGTGSVEIEAGFPLAEPIAGADGLLASHLPAGPAVATWHQGAYESLEPAYRRLASWIDQHGAQPHGAPWEVYHPVDAAAADPSLARTEIIQPFLLD